MLGGSSFTLDRNGKPTELTKPLTCEDPALTTVAVGHMYCF